MEMLMTPEQRFLTRFTKEPETIAWIDSLKCGRFWDVGANVGVYSSWAKYRGHQVTAFEPGKENVKILRRLDIIVRDFALGKEKGVRRYHQGKAGESHRMGEGEDLVAVERGRDWG